MVISDIQVIRMSFPNDEWDLVRMHSDDGAAGWGEISSSMNIAGTAAFIEELRDVLIGRDVRDIDLIMRDIERWEYPVRNDLRTFRCAVSGINQCLWDLFAKSLGVPLRTVYGAASVKSIPLYANLNKALRRDRRPEVLAEHASKAAAAGFSFLKCTPFDEIRPDDPDAPLDPGIERIRIVSGSAPISRIAIDCHQRFSRFTLARMVRRVLEEFGNPYWIEDTVYIDDYDTQRLIMEDFPEVRFAAGESAINEMQLLRTIDSGVYDVIMPDVKFIGGPGAVLSTSRTAELKGRQVSIHNPNGLIATAHSANLTAALRHAQPLEFPFMAIPERSQYSSSGEAIDSGRYVFSDFPGLGIEIGREALREFGRVFNNGYWKEF